VDDAGRLLGFARLQDARGGDASAGDATGTLAAGSVAAGVVADVMVRAETIAPDAEASEALRRIGEGEIGRLAVVDATGTLLGVLSKTDLIRRLREHGEAGDAA
jgi:CBS domain-containing protein